MREIKFRAFSERVGMFNVDVLSITDGVCDCDGYIAGVKRKGMSITAQPHLKLMQFTGLHDKNGTEIYEGDVVRYACGIGFVIYDHSEFLIRKNENGFLSHFSFKTAFHQVEVIGNIYQDKNLINT